jgi:hypothetical protein
MMEEKKRRPRGESPRGNFEAAKVFATTSEEERVAAAKKKTEALRAARLSQGVPPKSQQNPMRHSSD